MNWFNPFITRADIERRNGEATMTTTPETISLSEAAAIWLETGVWPNMQAPSICQGRDSWNKPGACSFEKIDKDGYKQSATFHKDQRFIKPVERKTCEEFVSQTLQDGIPGATWVAIKYLARRIDELEAKVK